MDAIMALCKRRGFIYQASEIYGGINGFWDYGPLGAQLKKNLRDAWWEDIIMVPCGGAKGPDGEPVSIVPLETCIIQHPKVWEASGHLAGFNDPMVDDRETKQRFRADHLYGLYVSNEDPSLPDRGIGKLASDAARAIVVPNKTAVASSALEAEEALIEAKKTLYPWILGPVNHGFQSSVGMVASANVTSKIVEGHFIAVIVPVPMEALTRRFIEMASPFTGKTAQLTPPKQFNLMFKTLVGATASEDDAAYLRPETAQGIFVQFKNVVDTTRVKVPFGIGNIGKSFRNEVTPRNFTFRSREFEQMELEFFCHADQARDWYAFWKKHRMEWWQQIGLAGDNLRLRDHETDELAHYAKAGAGVCDIEYRFPFTAPGFGELEGVAHRGNFDLTQHEKHSKVKMQFHDKDRGELLPNGQRKGEWYTPDCIEPAAGLDRGVLAIICEAYTVDQSRPSPEFMKFHPRLAPIKAAIFPLVNKDGMPEIADKLHTDLVKKFGKIGAIETDAKQSIGKRYARMDEAGCPFCFTIDGDTITTGTVTVRDRDTGKQDRIGIDKVIDFVGEKLGV
jgi:glycyl-tRNA synthetase